MRAHLLLPTVLLVLLVRCEPVGSNSVLARALQQATGREFTQAPSNGSSGGADCHLHFSEDNKVSHSHSRTHWTLTCSSCVLHGVVSVSRLCIYIYSRLVLTSVLCCIPFICFHQPHTHPHTYIRTHTTQCSDIQQLCPNVTCLFVKETDSCGSDGIIPYFYFLYCVVPHKLIPLAMVVLVSEAVGVGGVCIEQDCMCSPLCMRVRCQSATPS